MGCSIPEVAPITLFACQCSISKTSQAEFLHFEYVGLDGSQAGPEFSITLISCFSAVGVHELKGSLK